MELKIDQAPGVIQVGTPYSVSMSLDCSKCSDSYLRGVFFTPGTTKYFGLTQNRAGEWIDTCTDKTKYFKIGENEIVGSSWSGSLQININEQDSNFSGSGNYSFKVIRYTAGGSKSGETPESQISVVGALPTAVPTAIPTHKPSPTTVPVKSPTPTFRQPSPSPTVPPVREDPTPEPDYVFTPTFTVSQPPANEQVLSESTTAADVNPGDPPKSILLAQLAGIFLSALGLSTLVYSIYLFVYKPAQKLS